MNFLFRKNIEKMNYFTTILLVFLLIYFFILFSTYFFQRNLLYHPTENNYSGDQLNVSVEKIKIMTKDNIELDMGTPFDSFSEKSHHDFMDFDYKILHNRIFK